MRGKHFALIAVAAVVASIVVGAAAGRVFRPVRATAQEGVYAVKEMAVTDPDGNLRALVSASGDDSMSSIYFYDAGGSPRAGYVLSGDGEPMILMNSEAGEMRLAVGVTNEGGPAILLKDAKGKNVWEAPRKAPAKK